MHLERETRGTGELLVEQATEHLHADNLMHIVEKVASFLKHECIGLCTWAKLLTKLCSQEWMLARPD